MARRRVSNIDVKRINRISTMRCIFDCERISQPELTQKLSLSWPTVLQNVKELQAAGLVREVGTYESTGGRRARAFAPIRDARLALGLDITPNHVSAVLVNLSGDLVHYVRRKQPFRADADYFASLGRVLSEFLAETGQPSEGILGVGVSLPGILDETGETLTRSHALGLTNVPTSRFAEAIPFSCAFLNDANAAGLAELRGQPLKRNTVYLSLSNTVGGAILPGGTLFTGDNLRAGEFGHTTLIPGGRRCYCGKRGCLDAYCAARLLSDRTDGNLKQFFDRVRDGDEALCAIWEEYLDHLAIEVNNLRMTFDCDVIVGGYVGAYIGEYADELRRRLIERNPFEADADYFHPCRYKLEAAAVGAALTQIERFIEGI
ncbi:MAG: ROK family transcriptional regulator [Clostridia bacterium]|nr:ROK family transcriptional regulator [Clostridia bacterium]